MNFYKRYVEMCNGIGKSPSAVSVEIGLSKSTVNRWKKGGSPTDATALKIASYFGVSVTYLFEEDEKNPTTESDSGTANVELSEVKKNFIRKVEGMSDAQIQRLEQILALVEQKEL